MPTTRTLSARVARIRLAWPMALSMAGATAFAAYAVPAALVEAGVVKLGVTVLTEQAVPFDSGARVVLGLLAASIAGAAVWMLFERLERPERPKRAEIDTAIDLFAPETAPPLRKADSHPDAPVRRPLFAASDLGAPMDDVDRGPTPFGRPPLFSDDMPSVAVPSVGQAVQPGFSVGQDAAGSASPEPQRDESIAERMARLERGIARRGGTGAGSRPDPEQGLRDALAALRATTTRH